MVVNPVEHPADDSRAYYALAKALYEEHSFGGPEFRDSSDWSPGAPLLYAAAFYATGGAREGTARIVEALLGVGDDPRRLRPRLAARRPASCGRWVGLFAAFAVAVYPPFIHSTGELMSEPPAMLTLPAAMLAFLWAGRAPVAGPARLAGCPGLLFGLTAMFRPEYLFVGAAFVVLAAIRTLAAGARLATPGLAGAARARSPPCSCRSCPGRSATSIVLDRVVPISTGGGKALYVGTYLPADGEYQRVKAILAERYLGRDLDPASEALDADRPDPLFDRVAAAAIPDLTRDEASARPARRTSPSTSAKTPGATRR